MTQKVKVVYGGTSGIGKAIIMGFAEQGDIVIPISRDENKLKIILETLEEKNYEYLGLTGDVTNRTNVQTCLDKILSEYSHVDALVNSAGAFVKKPAIEISDNEWDSVLDTNLKGTFNTCTIFGKEMINKRSGTIVNIASMAGHVALSDTSPYAASKAGVLQLTRSLAIEWAEFNVRVNSISPGFFKTPLNEKALSDPIRLKNILDKTPMKRLGKLEELASVAIFLTTDASKFITGQNISVDGGFLAKGI